MILAIDTATDRIGISLDDGDAVLAERIWRAERHHTAELAPAVALMLRGSGVAASALEAIAVAQGPGSYTGLRIGMALAKGMALAHGLDLVGVPTLDVLASAQPPRKEPMLAVIQAGRGRIACVWYKWTPSSWSAQSAPTTLTWDQVLDGLSSPTYICGEIEEARGRLRQAEHVLLGRPEYCLRRPSFLGALARERLATEGPSEPAALAPVYLGELEGTARE